MRCLMTTILAACAALAVASPARSADLNEAEQAFVDMLTNATMVGRFSIDGKQMQPKEERYDIRKVQKLGGDKWLVTAHVKYGQHDVDVPVSVKVNWAGDTPVLSVTDISIPGLGQGFTTRVMFYRNRYAGSWYHGKTGGHMWGMIEPTDKGDADEGSEQPATK